MDRAKTSEDEQGGRKGYHHGNLREALVDAVLKLISEKGPNGFSFAEAARRAGVSPAAPYRHFKDRDALMAETAKRGFDLFADALERAWNGGAPSPLSSFEAVGRAYLNFARREPAYFAAMFEAGVSGEGDPELRAASDRAFQVLQDACAAVIATMPRDRRPPVLMMTHHIWAMAHGVTALFGRTDKGRRPAPFSAEDLLEAGTAVYLRGLGAIE